MKELTLEQKQIVEVIQTVWDFYHANARDLPWRLPLLKADVQGNLDSYLIAVSELMLQQTQVDRVISKFNDFTDKYPTSMSLSDAPLANVLTMWSGLGYNRRAKYLHEQAKIVSAEYAGSYPNDPTVLCTFPGIGPNTAAAIRAYAFNEPVVYVETNIRQVVLYHFFKHQSDVSDKQILLIVEQLLDKDNPREWYWALMDYGSHLKRKHGNLTKQSTQYTKQSTFVGSRRQVRGAVLRHLTTSSPCRESALIEAIADERAPSVINDLLSEGMIRRQEDEILLG